MSEHRFSLESFPYSKNNSFDTKISFSFPKNNQFYKPNTKPQCPRQLLHVDRAAVRVHELLLMWSWFSGASKVYLNNEKTTSSQYTLPRSSQQKGTLQWLFWIKQYCIQWGKVSLYLTVKYMLIQSIYYLIFVCLKQVPSNAGICAVLIREGHSFKSLTEKCGA